jgi:hypothetical protein
MSFSISNSFSQYAYKNPNTQLFKPEKQNIAIPENQKRSNVLDKYILFLIFFKY